MAATYNYSLKDLKELLKTIKYYQNTSFEIDTDIERLTFFIAYLSQRKNDKTETVHISTIIRQEIEHYAFLKKFMPFIQEFACIGENIDSLSITPNYQNITIPHRVAINDATSFLASHGPFFKEPLKEFSYDIKTHVKFLNKNLETTGGTLYLRSTGDAYIYAPNNHNISKTSVLTHELEHVIDCFNNPDTYETLITREIIPVFMELVSLEHYGEKYNVKKDAYQRMLYIYSIIKEQAHYFIAKMNMLDIISLNPNESEEYLLKLLNDNGFDLHFLTFLVKIPIQDFYYLIPELIAIELYFLYQNDKKKVISILQDISLYGNDYNILDIITKHNIKLNTNISSFEQHLLTKVKR